MQDLLFSGAALWFSVPALLGTFFFMLRLGMMLVGGVDDIHHDFSMDVDANVDLDMDVDVDHGDSSGAFKVLSIQAIAAFMMGFGWGGLGVIRGWGMPPVVGAVAGVGFGGGMMWMLARMLRWIYSMQSSGTVPLAAALDEEAIVDVLVPAGRAGRGQVRVVIGDRLRYYHAVTDGPAIESRVPVRVTEINEDNTLTVVPIQSELPPAGS